MYLGRPSMGGESAASQLPLFILLSIVWQTTSSGMSELVQQPHLLLLHLRKLVTKWLPLNDMYR